jgi:hypothetical protein
MGSTSKRPTRKPRALIVLCHFDETHHLNGRRDYAPQGVGHAFLAGAFDPDKVNVRIYSEFHSGPLHDESLMGWPDLLVLTGVTSSFDRMRQLTAYVRSKSPGVAVVAGGPAVRSLPTLSAQVFDYACQGDIEELCDVVDAIFGPGYTDTPMLPRFDLLTWKTRINYVESSRYCNFSCSFCALTAEQRKYQSYDLDYIEAQIRSYPSRKYLLFIDNNFYGNNRSAFLAKIDLLERLWREDLFPGWVALVTNDFFAHPQNLQRVRKAGCLGLFSGLESFNAEKLKQYNKKQNLVVPQVETIRNCLSAGVVYQYGMIFDLGTQRIDEIRKELEFVIGCHEIPLPAFLSLTIPLLRTPYFNECLEQRRFLPLVKLRDMDGYTLVTKPLNSMEKAVPFVRDIATLRGYGRSVLAHCYSFYRAYNSSLSKPQMINLLANGVRLCVPQIIHDHSRLRFSQRKEERLTYVTTTQPLGPLYRPKFRLASHFRSHFEPTLITDERGELHDSVADDLAPDVLPSSMTAGVQGAGRHRLLQTKQEP